jgi:hypothetical protein
MLDDFSQFGISRDFDDPFLLYSSDSMPRDLVTALDWCRFLYFLNPAYRNAASRTVRHFITDFDYPEDGDQKERDHWDNFLHQQVRVPDSLAEMGDDWACYGNGFFRIHFPFDRFLVDPRGGEYVMNVFPSNFVKFDLNSMSYDVPDPKDKRFPKGKHIKMKFRDRKSKDESRIRLVKIDPNYMTIEHNRVSGASRYIWRFDENIIADVKRGKPFIVNDMPQPMIQAIRDKQDFLFGPDQIFHFKAPTVSNVAINGWGIPGTLANYRSIFQLQVYRKIDEAVGLDYMVPFRLFTPVADPGHLQDVFQNMQMGQWTNAIEEIIRRRRKDKFAMHALPFPVNFQEFGYEGKELTPKDLIEYQTNNLLDGMGFPVELFKCSLQYMQVPTAVRMFENSFLFVQTGFDAFTKWASRKCRAYLQLPKMAVTLQRPSLADSLERKQILLQLSSAGEVSRELAYEPFGVDDAVKEVEKRMKEDQAIQRARVKLDQEWQREQSSGAAPSDDSGAASGSSPSASGGGGENPADISAKAQQLAQYWGSIPSDGERSKAMQAVKAQNPQLYALAKQMLEDGRNQGASQGRQQMNQQMQGAGGQGQSPGGQ